MIYLLNKKFVQLILWPGEAYTDNTYATKPESRSHIRIHFVNHNCIGSLCQSQMSQKPGNYNLLTYNVVRIIFATRSCAPLEVACDLKRSYN